MSADPSDITDLLARWRSGDRDSENALLAQVYPVLQSIARSQVRRSHGALTLQTTELAHEAYERLVDQRRVDWRNRDHFYAIAATLIRRIVVDHLRQRSADKRGGGIPTIALDQLGETDAPQIDESTDWLAIDQALDELAGEDTAAARIVELKFFSGLTTEQIATVTGSSVATVGRHWRYARAWLAARLADD